MDIGYLDFDEILRRLSRKEDDLQKACRHLAPSLRRERIMADFRRQPREDKPSYLKKLAKQYARFESRPANEWQEIVVDAIRGSGLVTSHLNRILGHAGAEETLYPMIARYFRGKNYRVHYAHKERIEIHRSIPDLIVVKESRTRVLRGYEGRIFKRPVYRTQSSSEVIAIDAKVDHGQLRRFYDQATDYQVATDKVYLATTTELVLEAGQEALERKLEQIGAGFIHVDATTGDCEIKLKAKRGKGYDRGQKKDLLDRLV